MKTITFLILLLTTAILLLSNRRAATTQAPRQPVETPTPIITSLADTCTPSHNGEGKVRPLLYQRADQSLWLAYVVLGTDLITTLACQRRLTASLSGTTDTVVWSLSPDQQWLAYVELKELRTKEPVQASAHLLHLATAASQVLFTALLPADYDWQVGTRDLDRSLYESKPLWSKDSTQLILVAAPTGRSSLYRYDITTSKLTNLAQSKQNIAWPRWSPDERYLLYNEIEGFGVGAGPVGGALWVVSADGTKPTRSLSQTDEFYEVTAGWLDQTHVRTRKTQFARGDWDWSIVDIENGERLPSISTEVALPPCWNYQPETNELAVKLQPGQTDYRSCNAAMGPTSHYATALIEDAQQQKSRLLLLDLRAGTVTTLIEAPSLHLVAYDIVWSPDVKSPLIQQSGRL